MMDDTIPKTGRIRTYTSGWPKNQKMCWNITGSPPPAALKKEVPKWRAATNLLDAAARTTITAVRRYAVVNHIQPNIGMHTRDLPRTGHFMSRVVLVIES